jgi:hypothetical protein
MLKKYLYAGILLGTVLLAACSVNEETEGQVKEEMTEVVADGQTVEVEPLSDTDKGEVASAAPLELTQKQKEDYYKQYVELAAQVTAENPGTNLSVVPIDEFKDWVEPEEFKKRLIDRANLKFVDSVDELNN